MGRGRRLRVQRLQQQPPGGHLPEKCIEPLWESKPDYEIYTLLAGRLGFEQEYTEGHTIDDWNRIVFDKSDLPKYVTCEEFTKKGYFVVPCRPDDEEPIVSFRWFYEGTDANVPSEQRNPPGPPFNGPNLATPSGKVEFVSQTLMAFDPDDEERPPMARYIPSWEGYDTKGLVEKWPLQMITPHPRFSYHTHNDNKSHWLDDIPQHRVKIDGYAYWPVRINTDDAKARGIKHHDLVKVFNDRGTVICAALVTDRMRPGSRARL